MGKLQGVYNMTFSLIFDTFSAALWTALAIAHLRGGELRIAKAYYAVSLPYSIALVLYLIWEAWLWLN